MDRRRRRLLAWGGLAAAGVGATILFLLLLPRAVPRLEGAPEREITSVLARDLPADAPSIRFVDATEEAGLRFVHSQGARRSLLPEDIGSGSAFGDYDGDGDPDLYLVNQPGPFGEPVTPDAPSSRLYRNDGGGGFADVTEEAGVGARSFGMGAYFFDLDGDGRLDLYVTNLGPNLLYRNRGDGAFEEIGERAGVADPGWSVGATAGDFDLDGDADLYVGNYVRFTPEGASDAPPTRQYGREVPFTLNPSSYPAERNTLLRNRGDGTFEDVTDRAGVADAEGRTLAVSFVDLDLDGRLDLYTANDVSKNSLFHNLGDGTFRDASTTSWAADYRGAMGIAVADVEPDGDLDLFLTHWIAQENALFENLLDKLAGYRSDPLRFMDVADRLGLGQSSLDFVGWGAEFLDADNDGRLDLLVVNGHTIEEPGEPARLVPQRAQLFWNAGRRGFLDVAPVCGEALAFPRVGRGAAFADVEGDGDLDVVVTENRGPAVLLRNDGGERASWLGVRVRGGRADRFALGAEVRVESAGRTQFRACGAGNSYASGSSTDLLFGLGAAERADRVEVRWLSGAVAILREVPARQVVEIEEPEGGFVEIRGATPERAAAAPADRRSRIDAFWTAFHEATERKTAGDLAGAEAAYRRALAVDPDHERALHDLANLLAARGETQEALALLRRLVAAHPHSAQGYSRIGAILSGSETGTPLDLERAREAYREAWRLNPEESGSLFQLGRACALLGEDEEALRRLGEAARLHPRHVEALLLAGEIRLRRGEPGVAIECLLRAANAAHPTDGGAPAVAGEGDTVESLAQAATRDPRLDRALRGLRAAADALGGYPPEVPAEYRLRR